MKLQEQIERAKTIRDVIMHEAPQDKEGDLVTPYKGWVNTLDNWITKGEVWLKNASPGGK